MAPLWLRWSWRDLRKRATQVAAIAGIIALGSGIYAGLGSTSVWRHQSLDTTFSRLSAHDIEVQTAAGSTVPTDQLLTGVRSAGRGALAVSEARLVADLPVRAGRHLTIPAAGVVVGVDLTHPIQVDKWKVVAGRSLDEYAGTNSVLLDYHFVQQHRLPPQGVISIAGNPVSYVGSVLEPEYLNTTTPMGSTIQGAQTRAVVFAPIGLVQRLAGAPGQANDVVALVRPGDNVEQVGRTLSTRLKRTLPDVAMIVTTHGDNALVQALYNEIGSEQRIFNIFALLILAGAGFAAFNLTRRVVEAQRRDIGVEMALGVPPRQISIRPIALATEIAVAGVAVGVLAGWAIGSLVIDVIRTQLPLPYWVTPWQPDLFVEAAALGLVIPLAGSVYPVWRAVRVAPTDALLPPHLRGKRHRSSAVLRRLRLPGGTLSQSPFRRVTIAPARSVMTVLAIGLILAPLLAALGTTDSTTDTIDTGSRILAGSSGNRLLVNFISYQPASSPTVSRAINSPLVGQSALGLDTGGYLIRGRTSIGVSISMVDLSDPLVVPEQVAGSHLAPGGIVISAKAASDLGVGVGELVRLRHPLRQGTGYRFADSLVPVRDVIASPYRFVAYMDLRDASIMGLDGIVNNAVLVPRNGVSLNRLQYSISSLPGVASALPARSVSSTMRNILNVVTQLFIILQVIIGLLAFLVAYNSSKIGSDERLREHATMMAFGVTVSRVVAIGVAESVLLGIAGIGVGLGVGLLILQWILDTVFPAAVPELSVLQSITPFSFAITAIIGLTAAAAAPTLVTRRLQRMDLPSALRYVE